MIITVNYIYIFIWNLITQFHNLIILSYILQGEGGERDRDRDRDIAQPDSGEAGERDRDRDITQPGSDDAVCTC